LNAHWLVHVRAPPERIRAKLANWLRAAADEVNRERAIDIRTAKKPMAAGKHMLKGIASRFLEDLE
jgi:hypothetical protein